MYIYIYIYIFHVKRCIFQVKRRCKGRDVYFNWGDVYFNLAANGLDALQTYMYISFPKI